MNVRIRVVIASMACACLAAPATMAQQIVYPAKGQNKQQQQKDESECAQWATQQTNYNPSNPPPATASGKPQTATGTDVGAGARGAARGAVVGGMMGDAGAGAAAGAVAARGQSRRTNRNEAQQATAQQSAAQQNYLKARAACLEGRGYTVK
jgi:hypothetical protein